MRPGPILQLAHGIGDRGSDSEGPRPSLHKPGAVSGVLNTIGEDEGLLLLGGEVRHPIEVR